MGPKLTTIVRPWNFSLASGKPLLFPSNNSYLCIIPEDAFIPLNWIYIFQTEEENQAEFTRERKLGGEEWKGRETPYSCCCFRFIDLSKERPDTGEKDTLFVPSHYKKYIHTLKLIQTLKLTETGSKWLSLKLSMDKFTGSSTCLTIV